MEIPLEVEDSMVDMRIVFRDINPKHLIIQAGTPSNDNPNNIVVTSLKNRKSGYFFIYPGDESDKQTRLENVKAWLEARDFKVTIAS